MSGNRSLDEFGGAGGGEEDGVAPEPDSGGDPADDEGPADSATDTGVDGDGSDDAGGSADPVVDGEPVDRPASTYRWSPDGDTCAACGETVEERWRDGEDLVCAGCKEW